MQQRSGGGARLGRALLVAAIAVVAGVIGSAVIGGVLGPPLPGPTAAPPRPGPASTMPSAPLHRVAVDPLTRRVSVDPWLTGQLPETSFGYDEPTGVKGLFAEVVIGTVNSDSGWVEQQNWPATVLVGDLEPKTVIEGDLRATAEGVAADLSERLYDALADWKVGDVRSDPPGAVGSYPAQWAYARASGRLSDGRDERADVAVLLVALPNGRYFGYADVRPDRPQARPFFAALDAARASISPV